MLKLSTARGQALRGTGCVATDPGALDGKVLDGRNRLHACQEAGVKPRYQKWKDPGCGPTEWVISQNLHRRHLNGTQRAFIALAAMPLFEKEARERQAKAGESSAPGRPAEKGSPQMGYLSPKNGQPKSKSKPTAKTKQEAKGKAAAKSSKASKVSRSYVEQAKEISKKAPDLVPALRSGEKTITQAKREIKERTREARREENREAIAVADVRDAEPQARFSTIVVDPPWDWKDEGDQDQLGRAKPTYGTMGIAELMDFRLGEWADTDCHASIKVAA